MKKDIDSFKKLLVEHFNVDKNNIQLLHTQLSEEFHRAKLPSNKIDHISKIFLNVIEKYNKEKIEMAIDDNTYNHQFLHKYGGDILNYYQKGFSPVKMLKQPKFKYLKNKPVPETIRNYLIKKGVWENKRPLKSNSMIEYQKARKTIKTLFDMGQSEDDIFLEVCSNNINVNSIKKELKKLEEKKALKEYVSKQINLNFNNKIIIDTAPEKYKKKVTNNLINTIRKNIKKTSYLES